MDPREYRISLVIPVYNGARYILPNVRRAAAFMRLLKGPNEIIVVDDASTDGTGRVLDDLKDSDSFKDVSLVILKNEQNYGKGYSVRRGILAARGRHLIFNDADFTYPLGEVSIIASYLEQGSDVVIGCRIHPNSRYVLGPGFIPYFYTRHVMSRIFNVIVNFFLHLGIRDTQAGIKGFSREAAQAIFHRQTLNRFSFDLEVLFIARWLGMKVTEVPVQFLYRKEPSTVRYVKDTLQILFDMSRIRWRNLTGRYQ